MIGSKILVSVLMPAYNHEKYVQDAIQSIVNQTYKNIELIVIDDGSTDTTWQRIQEVKKLCEKRFARVVFETKNNEGTCVTLNKLLDLAQGEFIYLIASDDLAKPQAIEKEIDFLVEHEDYALVVGDNELIDSSGVICFWDKEKNIIYDEHVADFKTFAEFLSNSAKIDFETSEFGRYDKVYDSNHIPNGYLVRKSIFEKIGNFVSKAPLEDYWLMLQVAKYAKMKFFDEILYSYRWHNSNSIKNCKKIERYTEMTKEYEEYLLDNADEKEFLSSVFKIKYGYLEKTINFFNILVLEKHRFKRKSEKIKILKLFNYPILKWSKKPKIIKN